MVYSGSLQSLHFRCAPRDGPDPWLGGGPPSQGFGEPPTGRRRGGFNPGRRARLRSLRTAKSEPLSSASLRFRSSASRVLSRRYIASGSIFTLRIVSMTAWTTARS